MPTFAVARVAKLRTAGQIAAVHGHNSRSRPTPNADQSKQNHGFRKVDDAVAAVHQVIEQAGAKTRSNSVLAMEMILSASPEYFRPGQADQAGVFDDRRTKKWANTTWRWLKDRYGDRIVDCRIHLDESTPHIQAIIVPLTDDGRLSAKETFGKMQLKKLQSDYAEAIKDMGIRRGIEGSKSKHSKVRRFYEAVNTPAPEIEGVRSILVPKPPLTGREEWASGLEAQAADLAAAETARISHQVADLTAKAALADMAQDRMKEMQQTIEALAQERDEANERARKAEAAKLRDVPLATVAAAAGLDQDDQGRWIGPGHDIKITGQKWFDDGDAKAAGRGSIDLVKHLQGCDYDQALGWLRDKCGGQAVAVGAAAVAAEQAAIDVVQTAKAPDFKRPAPVPEYWQRVRDYLTGVRKLAGDIIDRLHSQGFIYADDRANAVFLHGNNKRSTGAELRGTHPTKRFAGMSKGTDRNAGFFAVKRGDGGGRLVLVESAIDALSYYQSHTKDAYVVISTGGCRAQLPWLLPYKGNKIVVAYDNDEAGNSFAAKLGAWCKREGFEVTREAPRQGCKDWNDEVVRPAPFKKKIERDRGSAFEM